MKKKNKPQDTPRSKGVLNPKTIINNPAIESSGRETDYRNIRDTGHSVGGGLAESRDGQSGNYMHPDDEKDFNRAGNVRNQTDEIQSSVDKPRAKARPVSKYGGVQGKTMVKNVGLTETDTSGELEGGNHGGGNAANKRFGNQKQVNSSINQQVNQSGGDYKGMKNKK